MENFNFSLIFKIFHFETSGRTTHTGMSIYHLHLQDILNFFNPSEGGRRCGKKITHWDTSWTLKILKRNLPGMLFLQTFAGSTWLEELITFPVWLLLALKEKTCLSGSLLEATAAFCIPMQIHDRTILRCPITFRYLTTLAPRSSHWKFCAMWVEHIHHSLTPLTHFYFIAYMYLTDYWKYLPIIMLISV